MPVYKIKDYKTIEGKKVKKNKEEYNRETSNGTKVWQYQVCYTDLLGNKKKYRSKKFATKEEATKEEAKFRISIGKEIKEDFTFNSIYNEYYLYKSDKIRETSLSRLPVQYKHIEPYLGNVKITKLTKQQFILWQKTLNETDLSTNYKNKIYSLLQELLNYSEKMYNITSKVPQTVGRFVDPNETKKEMEFYTYDEFKIFISNINDLTYKCFFETLYYCGFRLGETQALNWNDINFKEKTITISKSLTTKLKGQKYKIMPPKTKSSNRTIPIPNKLLEDLEKHFEECEKIEGFNKNCFVFGIFNPLPDTTIKKKRDIYAEKANIKKIRIHDFRHSCASLLINHGANITLVAKYLGHSNISMTLNTYSHMYKSKLDEIVDLINKL